MFYLVPQVAIFLVLFFAVGLAWRLWRRREIPHRPPWLIRVSRRLGRATSRRPRY